MQVPSRVPRGPTQIRQVLCFMEFRTHPDPEAEAIGPILVPNIPSGMGRGRTQTDFLATSEKNLWKTAQRPCACQMNFLHETHDRPCCLHPNVTQWRNMRIAASNAHTHTDTPQTQAHARMGPNILDAWRTICRCNLQASCDYKIKLTIIQLMFSHEQFIWCIINFCQMTLVMAKTSLHRFYVMKPIPAFQMKFLDTEWTTWKLCDEPISNSSRVLHVCDFSEGRGTWLDLPSPLHHENGYFKHIKSAMNSTAMQQCIHTNAYKQHDNMASEHWLSQTTESF